MHAARVYIRPCCHRGRHGDRCCQFMVVVCAPLPVRLPSKARTYPSSYWAYISNRAVCTLLDLMKCPDSGI
jgi:hypothetical protein